MEFYEDSNCPDPAPPPAPVEICEPAPLPAFEPPAPAPPAAEIFPEVPAAPVAPAPAAPVADVTPPAVEAPLPQPVPEPAQPLAPAPLTAGALLGPSTVGGSSDLGGSGFVGGSPQLGGSTILGSSSPDLGGTWVDSNGTPVAAPNIPVVPGPFDAAAANIVDANNAAIVDGMLSGGSSGAYPAPWTPGYDSDDDGIFNERDRDPRKPSA